MILTAPDSTVKVKVREEGLTVPKDMLGDVDEAELREETGRIRSSRSEGIWCLAEPPVLRRTTTDTSTTDESSFFQKRPDERGSPMD